jgi:hypothetical protein
MRVELDVDGAYYGQQRKVAMEQHMKLYETIKGGVIC